MGEEAVAIWVIVVMVVGLNGFAAGMVAGLSIWRRSMRRRARIMSASAIAGLLPASIFAVAGASELSGTVTGEEPVVWSIVVGLVLIVAAGVSLPGAVIVGRNLEKPGNEHRAFE